MLHPHVHHPLCASRCAHPHAHRPHVQHPYAHCGITRTGQGPHILHSLAVYHTGLWHFDSQQHNIQLPELWAWLWSKG